MQDPLYQFLQKYPSPHTADEMRTWLEEYPGGVYFLHSPAVGLTKIGRATSFVQRLRSIQAMNADRLVFVGGVSRRFATNHYNTPAAQIERELHDDFADRREHGEWFRLGNPHLEFYACRVNSDVMTFGCTVDEFLDLLAANREYEMHLWRRQEMREEAKTFIRKVQVH